MKWFYPVTSRKLKDQLYAGFLFGDSIPVRSDDVENARCIRFFSLVSIASYLEAYPQEDVCFVELDVGQIAKLAAHYEYKGDDGGMEYRDIMIQAGELPDIEGEDINLVIRAPLPLQCIGQVCFCSDNDKRAFVFESQRIIDDVFFKKCIVNKAIKTICEKTIKQAKTESVDEIPVDNPVIAEALYPMLAYGGVLGLLYYQTKNGQYSDRTFTHFETVHEEELAGFNEYNAINKFFKSRNQSSVQGTELLYKLVLEILSNGQIEKVDIVQGEILRLLQSGAGFQGRFKERLLSVADGLVRISDRLEQRLPEEVFSEEMQRIAVKDSEKVGDRIVLLLLMLFFRDTPETMLKFYLEKFGEKEYLLFAMFFGALAKYTGLPQEIKTVNGIPSYLSNKMVELNIGEQCFKPVKPPKRLFASLIKDKLTERNGLAFEKILDELELEDRSFKRWEIAFSKGAVLNELNIKHGQCVSGAILTDSRPVLKMVVDIEALSVGIRQATINNDRDLVDYSKLIGLF